MQDSVLDLASDDTTSPARSMVAQMATLARAFLHEAQAMKAGEIEDHLAKLARIEGDQATIAARNLVSTLLSAEMESRRVLPDDLQAAAG